MMASARPEVTPLVGGPVLNWAVLGPGEIAHDFTATVLAHTDQRIVAVGSRSLERAKRFAARFGIPRAYGSYEETLADAGVDVVYLATPNVTHRELAVASANAGKHVVIEKPFATDATDAAALIEGVTAAGVFAMEAMWTRFLPQTLAIEGLLAEGAIGNVEAVFADFGADFSGISGHVLDPRGGGALRDIGIYPVWLATWILGIPTTILATGGRHRVAGVDDHVGLILNYGSGAQAVLHTSMRIETPTTAVIAGTKGRIEINSPFLMPDGFTLHTTNGASRWRDPTSLRLREGLAWQAAAVASHIAAGLTESPLHTLTDALRLTEILDDARAQVLAG